MNEVLSSPHTLVSTSTRQVFSIPVQSQACKKGEIVFLVTRSELKLTLTGRSDFEEVQPPAFIGKGVKRFYSQAVIAHQAGQSLAGVFLLRTLIEQHMRLIVQDSSKMRGDELCDRYSDTLPENFRQQFPSLKEIYGKLSDAMHTAVAEPDFFEAQRVEIDRHFDALRLVKLHQS